MRSWPAMRRGISFCFCSSVPNFASGIGPKMLRCSALAPEKPAPLSATACMAIAASVTPRPEPPSSTGMGGAPQPPPPGHRPHQAPRELAGFVGAPPVVGVEAGAEPQDPVADRLLLVG